MLRRAGARGARSTPAIGAFRDDLWMTSYEPRCSCLFRPDGVRSALDRVAASRGLDGCPVGEVACERRRHHAAGAVRLATVAGQGARAVLAGPHHPRTLPPPARAGRCRSRRRWPRPRGPKTTRWPSIARRLGGARVSRRRARRARPVPWRPRPPTDSTTSCGPRATTPSSTSTVPPCAGAARTGCRLRLRSRPARRRRCRGRHGRGARAAAREVTDPADREHVTTFIKRHTDRFRCVQIARPGSAVRARPAPHRGHAVRPGVAAHPGGVHRLAASRDFVHSSRRPRPFRWRWPER